MRSYSLGALNDDSELGRREDGELWHQGSIKCRSACLCGSHLVVLLLVGSNDTKRLLNQSDGLLLKPTRRRALVQGNRVNDVKQNKTKQNTNTNLSGGKSCDVEACVAANNTSRAAAHGSNHLHENSPCKQAPSGRQDGTYLVVRGHLALQPGVGQQPVNGHPLLPVCVQNACTDTRKQAPR